MTIIVLLISIGMQYFLNFNSYPYRLRWIQPYTQKMTAQIGHITQGHGLVGLLILVVPLLLVVSLVFAAIYHLLGYFGYFIANLILVWYCLDARDLRKNPLPVNNPSNVLVYSYRHLFGVIFWYAILGPVGLAFYFIIQELREYLETQPIETQGSLLNFTQKMQGVVDWLPIRLLGLTFAFVGHFGSTFQMLKNDLLSSIKTNPNQIVTWGLVALAGDRNNEVVSIDDTIGLIERALIVWLTAILLFNIFFWLG